MTDHKKPVMTEIYEPCAQIMKYISNGEAIDLPAAISRLLSALSDTEVIVYNPLIINLSIQNFDLQTVVKFFERAHHDVSHEVLLIEGERAADGSIEESERALSIGEFLALCLEQTCHQTMVPCKALDNDGKCRNGGEQDDDGLHLCDCSFHLEPLYAHLILAAFSALYSAQASGMDSEDQYFAFLTALLHDIAKPLTMSTYEFKDDKTGDVRIFPLRERLWN